MKKKVEEKLVNRTLVKTAVAILVMILIALAKKGYEYPYGTMSLTTGKIVLAAAILLLINAAVFVYLGFNKSQKYFEISACSAGLATLAMLIKINFGPKDLLSISSNTVNKYALIHFNLPSFLSFLGTLTFYRLVMIAFVIYIIVLWVKLTLKIVKK